MKKIFSLSLLTLGSVALLAFGQEFTAEEQAAFEEFSELYGPFKSIDEVGDWCAKDNFEICMNFADERGLKDYDDKHREMAAEYEKIYDQCKDDLACYLKNADNFAESVENFDPKLAQEVKRAANFAQVTEVAGDEGVVIPGFGKVTEENFADFVVKEGVEKAFETVQNAMIAQYSDEAAKYGFNPEEFTKYADQMTDEMKTHFLSKASDNLYLGPPIEVSQESYPDYFTQEMQTQMEGILNLDTEEARQAAMKGFAEEHGMDGNYNDGTYSPGMWSDTSAWQAPEGGWTESNAGNVDYYNMSPDQMNPDQIQMMNDYLNSGGTMPTNYTPGALLYILLDLFR